MFSDLYEVRRRGDMWAVVHIRSGRSVEERIRYRNYAEELCRRYNACI
jgi:hypothetical protein